MFKSSVKITMKLTLAAHLGFSPLAAHAADAVINANVNIRVYHPKLNEMIHVGSLKKGSVLTIPDKYIEFRNSRPHAEFTLNKWLQQAGQLVDVEALPAGKYNYDSDKSEYFFPVKIKELAPGSTQVEAFSNATVYVALSQLQRNNNLLILRKDHEVRIQKTPTAEEESETETVTAAKIETECHGCSLSKTQKAVNTLLTAIAIPLANAETKAEEKATRYEINKADLKRSFQNKCGMSYEAFEKEMHNITSHNKNLYYLLESIIVNESAGVGLCKAKNSLDNGAGSWGLFQINAASSKHDACKAIADAEVEHGKGKINFPSLVKKPDDVLNKEQRGFKHNYLACSQFMQNPVNNLKEAYRIILAKHNELFVNIHKGQTAARFDKSKMSEADQFRLILSAYNGGEGWIYHAKAALTKFNEVNGSDYNHNNWEDLRLFYFRRAINAPAQHAIFNEGPRLRKDKTSLDRAVSNTLTNLAYVESIIPRNTDQIRSVSGLVALLPSQRLSTSSRALAYQSN